MATTANSTNTPAPHGPVSSAIFAMRSEPSTFPGDHSRFFDPIARPQPLARSPLANVTIGGLLALYEAHREADNALTHAGNAPRIVNDRSGFGLLEDACEWHRAKVVEVVEELQRRRPTDGWDRAFQLKTLIAWHVDAEEWDEVLRLIQEAQRD